MHLPQQHRVRAMTKDKPGEPSRPPNEADEALKKQWEDAAKAIAEAGKKK